MPRILYFIDDLGYLGGAHIATYNQIHYLISTGKYQISIVSATQPPRSLVEMLPLVDFINIESLGNERVYKLFSTSIKDVFTDPSFSFADKMKKLNMSVYLRIHGYQKAISYFIENEKHMQAVQSFISQYDIVCVPFENSKFRDLVTEAVCKRKIQWIHIDYLTWKNVNGATKAITRNDYERYKQFDQIVFVSYTARRGFLLLYPEFKDKCAVCYNLLDINKIKTLANHSAFDKGDTKERRPIRIVTVARLEDIQKGIKRSLDVAKRLLDAGYLFEWFFVGSGVDEDMLKQYAKQLELDSCVHWVGQVENPYMYIKHADLFALFSYYEGIPNTIFESLIIGTPVIATKVNGICEQLKDGWGFLVDNDTESIYRGLSDLLKNPQKIEMLREKLKAYKYDNETIQKELENIMNNSGGYHNGKEEEIIKVSVIVPVYNVEKYLGKCLDTLVAQTIDSIEIIVVNDGSTDGSQNIIDSYAKKYPGKIKSFIKKNGGLGDARNYGLKYAKGYYVSFIDSDDWVSPTMMERMYKKGVENNADIVLCDIYGVDDQTNHTVVEHAPYDKEGILDRKQAVLFSTRPVAVSACTKLFKRKIFDRFKFPYGWYEDLAIMTTIFSYAERIYYLSEPHYYYRWNRSGSIQSQKSSPKTLEILNAQQNILDTCNPEFFQEAAYAIYDHSARFHIAYPMYRTQNLEFIDKNIKHFINNPHINWAIENGILPRLFSEEKIPKIIHYCWFGKGEKSNIILDCIKSWKEQLPDYKIIEWNESNCNIDEIPYVSEAYKQKKWAFVSDYFRFKVLYEYGGIYMDTDVMVYSTLNHLLVYDAFFAFETYLYVHGGIIGSKPKQPVIKMVLDGYKNERTFNRNGYLTVCHRITDALLEYGLIQNGKYQILRNNIAIFPPNVLTVDFSDGECIAEHLFNGSWLENKGVNKSYKYEVMKHFFTYPLSQTSITSGGNEPEPTPYEAVDAAIRNYGIKVAVRQLIKAIIKRLIPKKVYNRIVTFIRNDLPKKCS